MHQTIADLATTLGVAQACHLLGVPRSQYYRALRSQLATPPAAPVPAVETAAGSAPPAPSVCYPHSPRARSAADRDAIRAVLTRERFADQAPREISATLLDEGVYLCSWPTMYRLLREHGQTTRRRDHLQRGAYAKPELLATAPNQLWSWAITKLKGPATWTYY